MRIHSCRQVDNIPCPWVKLDKSVGPGRTEEILPGWSTCVLLDVVVLLAAAILRRRSTHDAAALLRGCTMFLRVNLVVLIVVHLYMTATLLVAWGWRVAFGRVVLVLRTTTTIHCGPRWWRRVCGARIVEGLTSTSGGSCRARRHQFGGLSLRNVRCLGTTFGLHKEAGRYARLGGGHRGWRWTGPGGDGGGRRARRGRRSVRVRRAYIRRENPRLGQSQWGAE